MISSRKSKSSERKDRLDQQGLPRVEIDVPSESISGESVMSASASPVKIRPAILDFGTEPCQRSPPSDNKR
jgi:hypothetical protein